MRTQLDSLDSPRQAKECTAGLAVLVLQFFNFFIICLILLLKTDKLLTHHVVHLLVSVLYFLFLLHRAETAVGNPCNGNTDTA